MVNKNNISCICLGVAVKKHQKERLCSHQNRDSSKYLCAVNQNGDLPKQERCCIPSWSVGFKVQMWNTRFQKVFSKETNMLPNGTKTHTHTHPQLQETCIVYYIMILNSNACKCTKCTCNQCSFWSHLRLVISQTSLPHSSLYTSSCPPCVPPTQITIHLYPPDWSV